MAFFAYNKFVKKSTIPADDTLERTGFAGLSYHKFYVDEIYDKIIIKPINALSLFFANVVDRLGIDGLVNGIGKSSFTVGKGIRLLQSGNVGFYLLLMVIGVIVVFVYGLLSF